MRLKLTLVRPGARSTHLAVTADATATVADLALSLFAGDPAHAASATPDRLTVQVAARGVADGAGRQLDPGVDLLSAGLRSGETVSLVRTSEAFTTPGEGRGPAAAVLRVLSGADAGREFSLPFGTSYVGRAHDADVRLSDPLVSKRHARISIGDAVEVSDLASANGLQVGGARVARSTLAPTDTVVLGDSEISVVLLRRVVNVAPTTTVIQFNRSPRVVLVTPVREIDAPEPPRAAKPRKFPLVAMVAPLLMGSVMFTLTHNPLSLVFVALSPVIMVGTWLDAAITGRRELRGSSERFAVAVEATTAEIDEAHRLERAVRLAAHPSTTAAAEAVRSLGALLWSRRPEHDEFLTVRLGLGPARSLCTLSVPARGDTRPEDWTVLARLETLAADIQDVPVVADFRSAGAVGLAGQRDRVAAVARAAILQLAALHSPAELVLAVLASPSSRAEWEWLQWLPHTGSAHSPIPGDLLAADAGPGSALLARLEAVVAQRRDTDGGRGRRPASRGRSEAGRPGDAVPPAIPSIVVVVEDDAPVDRARLTRLAESGPDVNVHVLWVGLSVTDLPGACRAFLLVGADDATGSAGFVRDGLHVHPVETEALGCEEAESLARALAPVEDAGALVEDDAGLPRSISFLSLVGAELGDDPALQVDRWRESGSIVDRGPGARVGLRADGTLRAVIGQAGAEPMVLDLRSQGPHALVGGTTGAGKSEFLQAWVLGMATTHSPDRVSFLLVDYKGGAAFADCVDLPHTVGLVTDLSPYLVRRALTSLRAELRHREHLLNRKKVKDLVSLERTGDPDAPPSLIIVVDEFAALASEVPEFVDGVVDVAQRGRSLGLHLILATQRPAGVIRDNLRANTNLRVALRMADEDDSNDVLGSPIAAHFDPMLPGRGAVRTGPGRITPFQSGYAGGRTVVGQVRPRVDIEEMDFGPGRAWEVRSDVEVDADAPEPPSDIARVVRTVEAAARSAGIPLPRKPWLPVLAKVYDLARLRQRTDTELAIGVADDPENQEQRTVYFLPEVEGNLAVFGAGGSGKSGLLRTLAAAAAITPRGGPVHVFGLDFGGGALSALECLPNVGSIIQGDDAERVGRLMLWLRDLVDSRAGLFTAARAATLSEYRSLAGKPHEPRILVLIDGFGTFRQEYETAPGRSAVYALFQQLLADGRAVGIHVVLSADRPGAVPASVSASIQRTIVLRQSDENAYLVLDAPRDVLSAVSPPGRAMDSVGWLELQVALLGGSPNVAEQARALEQLARSVPDGVGHGVEAIRRLPELVPAASMPREVRGLPVLGVADDTLEPMGFDPVGTFLVSGPPASGRTTAVRTIAAAIARWRPGTELFHVTGRASPLSAHPMWTRSARAVDDVVALARELLPVVSSPPADGAVGVVLCLEAIADFLGGPAEGPLTDVIKQAKRNGHFIVAEADSAAWGSSWPLLVEVRSGRRGLSLQPDQLEGDLLFRTPFPRVTRTEFPPGRGLVVQSGRVRRVQLPQPD